MMDKFALLVSPKIVSLAAHALFWPIASTQLLMNKMGYLDWYSEVFRVENQSIPGLSYPAGGRILLGGIPWPESTRQTLLKQENVSAVVNLVSEKDFPFSVEKRLDIPLADFVHPKTEDIKPAIEFIDKCLSEGRTVYVHCRAGKGRSATVVMCWLVSRMHMDPETAQEYLTRKRPQILQSLKDRDVVKEFSSRKNS